jgi:hypothetical protein
MKSRKQTNEKKVQQTEKPQLAPAEPFLSADVLAAANVLSTPLDPKVGLARNIAPSENFLTEPSLPKARQ